MADLNPNTPELSGQADTEIKRLYERWQELGEQCRRESAETKSMTAEEAEPYEDAFAAIDEKRQEIERALADTPAVSPGGVLLKISLSRHWIKESWGDEPDTGEALALSVFDDVESLLVEAAG